MMINNQHKSLDTENYMESVCLSYVDLYVTTI